jgi:hypothetical protein
MKNIIRTMLFATILAQLSFVAVFAVGYDDLNDTVFTNSGDVNSYVDTSFSGEGYSYNNFDPSTPVSYSDLNNTNFTNSGIYYGNETCVGCTIGSDVQYAPINYQTYDNYQYGPAYVNYGNTGYGTVNYGTVGSIVKVLKYQARCRMPL